VLKGTKVFVSCITDAIATRTADLRHEQRKISLNPCGGVNHRVDSDSGAWFKRTKRGTPDR